MPRMYRGRIPYVDPTNPSAYGKDDITGLPVNHPDMVKQYDYIGNSLAWTGFMVHYKDADQPNPQKIPPRLRPDPIPIKNPRFLALQQLPPVPTGLAASASTSTSVTLTWNQVNGIPAYVIGWKSPYVTGETRGITDTTYEITGLTPGNTYRIAVAATADNSSEEASEFSTTAFSSPIQITLSSS